MRRNAGRMLLAAAAVLAVFIGKGSEAKAYEVVGGVAYMTWDEYEAAERRGGAPEGCVISEAFQEGGDSARNFLYTMDEYVPSWYFDYDWYLERHPELAGICGTDRKAIYAFYANTGQANGWYGRVAPDKLVELSDFDYVRYAAENPDVAAAIGQDAAALYNHYVNYGIKEGRSGYVTDDFVNAYLKIYEVSSRIINPGMSDRERIKAVHDWMCLNMRYDRENYDRGTIPAESYDVTGAMNKGVVVCQGYAETFKDFMSLQGIECEIITSENHAWNKVKVDGEYYYIDVTWDDTDNSSNMRYDYYLSKDPTFGGEPDHIPEVDEWDIMFGD